MLRGLSFAFQTVLYKFAPFLKYMMDVEYDETHILRKIKEGDKDIYRKLYEVYYYRLFCIARQYLRDDFVAETIVSDVFFHLWENSQTLDVRVSLNAYLIRMVRNFSLNYLQKNYVEREVSLNDMDISSPLLFLSDDYPLGRLMEKEVADKIYQEIELLPKATREVFVLSRFQELKHEEVAERLGISVNTVKYHVKQALSILRARLKDYLISLFIGLTIYF